MGSLRSTLAAAGIGLIAYPFVSAMFGLLIGTIVLAGPFYVAVLSLRDD